MLDVCLQEQRRAKAKKALLSTWKATAARLALSASSDQSKHTVIFTFAPTKSQASRIVMWDLLLVSNHKRKADSPLRLTQLFAPWMWCGRGCGALPPKWHGGYLVTTMVTPFPPEVPGRWLGYFSSVWSSCTCCGAGVSQHTVFMESRAAVLYFPSEVLLTRSVLSGSLSNAKSYSSVETHTPQHIYLLNSSNANNDESLN